MSNLKDTDIDDLFRRASDKYPLRTDSADWDRMAAALENKGDLPPVDGVDAEEKRKKRRFFWLFLLLPLFGAGYYVWHHAGNAGPTANRGTIVNAGTAADAGTGSSRETATNTRVAGNAGSATDAGIATNGDAAKNGTAASNRDAATNAGPAKNSSRTTNSSPAANGGVVATDRYAKKETKGTKPDNSLSLTAANARRQPGGENNAENSVISQRDDETTGDVNSSTGGSGNRFGAKGPVADNDRLFYDLQRAPIPRDYRLTVDVTAPAVKKDSVAKPTTKIKHFYAGIFGSPDLSTVKMQSVNGVGTTFGLILGYTFNGGHWAIETGAYVDRKKYYTDGDDFNTKEVRIPYNSWLTDVNGICYMWEIPLNVRYNFNPGAKTSWFATAGLSTYLMSHEKYTYGLEWPGSVAPYDSTWNFHNASQYPFSIINLSAGFEQRLGKIGNLRVEPYVRLPLTGLGTGKLPIMSAGVNIGITRQLW